LKRIIFIYPTLSSFIKHDLAILMTKFNVYHQNLSWQKKLATPLNLLRQFIFILDKIKSTDAIIVSFAGYWSLFPIILGNLYKKPTFIILHGTDTVSMPQFNYGSLRKPVLRFFILSSIRNATKLFPVSKYLIYSKNTYINSIQGIKAYLSPKINLNYTVIPNGFKINDWICAESKEKSFVSVISGNRFELKGGEEILTIAKKYQNYIFYLVGSVDLEKIVNIPKNVVFLGYLNQKSLNKVFSKSQFYLQLSLSEGFGCSLAESMLCNCVPIVSCVNEMPNIVGENGFIVDKRSEDELLSIIEEAIKTDRNILKEMGENARNSIIDRYSLKQRKIKLIEEIENYTN